MEMLRLTVWPTPDDPYTIVVPVQDLAIPPDEFIERSAPPEGFYTEERFVASGAIEGALEANRRATEKAEVERNMAILYYFDVKQLAKIKDEGMLTSTVVAPFDMERAAFALKQLARNPRYKHQTRILPCEDGIVTMRDGSVEKKAYGKS
jgi:hypothetical protein